MFFHFKGSLKSPPVGGGGHEIPSPTLTLNDEGEDSDNGEPLLSGFGEVSKECSGNELEMWSQMLQVRKPTPFEIFVNFALLYLMYILRFLFSGLGQIDRSAPTEKLSALLPENASCPQQDSGRARGAKGRSLATIHRGLFSTRRDCRNLQDTYHQGVAR